LFAVQRVSGIFNTRPLGPHPWSSWPFKYVPDSGGVTKYNLCPSRCLSHFSAFIIERKVVSSAWHCIFYRQAELRTNLGQVLLHTFLSIQKSMAAETLEKGLPKLYLAAQKYEVASLLKEEKLFLIF
jgi:hypothetical protein